MRDTWVFPDSYEFSSYEMKVQYELSRLLAGYFHWLLFCFRSVIALHIYASFYNSARKRRKIFFVRILSEFFLMRIRHVSDLTDCGRENPTICIFSSCFFFRFFFWKIVLSLIRYFSKMCTFFCMIIIKILQWFCCVLQKNGFHRRNFILYIFERKYRLVNIS